MPIDRDHASQYEQAQRIARAQEKRARRRQRNLLVAGANALRHHFRSNPALRHPVKR